MSKELIERLRGVSVRNFLTENTSLYNEAANLIEQQNEAIDSLVCTHAEHKRVIEQQQREIEDMRNVSRVESMLVDALQTRLDSAEKLIEQLVDALDAETKYQRSRGGDVVAWVDEALAAAKQWKEQ